MSSPDPLDACATRLRAALDEPALVTDAALQQILSAAIRLYAARADLEDVAPFGPRHVVTANDVMIATTEMLRSVNVQLFELSMWQSLCGMDRPVPPKVETPS